VMIQFFSERSTSSKRDNNSFTAFTQSY